MKPQMEEVEDDLAAEEENKLINEEYKTWKKNAPYLYDVVITHALEWPSLTCQWFPDKESPANKPYTTHRLLLGTHTSGQAQDYLQIATVHIPKREGPASGGDKLDAGDYDDERGELGGHTIPPTPHVQIIQKINHAGEVNRARYMPQNPDLIATKAVTGEVFVFDRTKHSSEPERGGVCKPDIRLVGQNREGFGLAWNPVKAGHVLGASEDMTVCHWDINSYTKANTTIEPTTVFRGHTSVVGDVDWHATDENLFASVGDDKMLMIWDKRTPSEPKLRIQAHEHEILAVAFSPAAEHLLVTGSADKTCVLHDMRVPGRKLHIFESHTDEVLHVAWSPHNPSIFASASSDRRINIWDLSLIGQEQTPDDQEDGPPELLFVHGGHTARPTDFSWAPGEAENWTIASASEDNIVMVWQPTMRVWAGDEIKIDERELEPDAMDGVETVAIAEKQKVKGAKGSGSGGSLRSQSMDVSATSGDE
ncbi:putative histone-binding protein RBBP4 or subunit C of CAF1 complex [Lyophyllum shimeji]|uniref:Histone-binding protein RBBP4 or subunit C of CAF1 complex n=1 Tax=Lyophyllum shimeji TaxID=47721 RepID=A0A9P3PWY8_LYOSH|nr:putative histone-binding protein RBBP4 or subunit C of CAF1 complex [Lyophyllum shimeji]